MLEIIYWSMTYLTLLLLGISVSIGAFKYRELPDVIQYFWYFLVWNLLIEMGQKIIKVVGYSNNLPLLHIYTLGEFILLSFFYKKLFLDGKKPYYFQLFLILFSIVIVSNSMFFQSIYGFNSYAKTMVNLMIIAAALNYFMLFIRKKVAPEISGNSIQLINVAILIYYCGSFFIFMFSNSFLINKVKIPIELWAINSVLYFLFQILILIVIWKTAFYKKTKFSS